VPTAVADGPTTCACHERNGTFGSVGAAEAGRTLGSMRRRRLLVIALVAILVLGLLVPAGLWYLRLHPIRVAIDDDPGAHGLAYESISFSSPLDETPLTGWYMPASGNVGVGPW